MRNPGEILQGINKQTACLALRQVYYFLPEINKIHIVKGKTAHGLPAQINISSSELVGELKCHFYTGEETFWEYLRALGQDRDGGHQTACGKLVWCLLVLCLNESTDGFSQPQEKGDFFKK